MRSHSHGVKWDAPRTRNEEAEQEGGDKGGYDETHGPYVELVHKRRSQHILLAPNQLYRDELTLRA